MFRLRICGNLNETRYCTLQKCIDICIWNSEDYLMKALLINYDLYCWGERCGSWISYFKRVIIFFHGLYFFSFLYTNNKCCLCIEFVIFYLEILQGNIFHMEIYVLLFRIIYTSWMNEQHLKGETYRNYRSRWKSVLAVWNMKA